MWFKQLKHLNTANTNIDLNSASDQELEDFVGTCLPITQMLELKVFRRYSFNDLLATALRGARKTAKKTKIDILYTTSATALACIEAGIYVVDTLSKHNPAAGELLKRHLKKKVTSW